MPSRVAVDPLPRVRGQAAPVDILPRSPTRPVASRPTCPPRSAVPVVRVRDRREPGKRWRAPAARSPHGRDRIAGSRGVGPLRRWQVNTSATEAGRLRSCSPWPALSKEHLHDRDGRIGTDDRGGRLRPRRAPDVGLRPRRARRAGTRLEQCRDHGAFHGPIVSPRTDRMGSRPDLAQRGRLQHCRV